MTLFLLSDSFPHLKPHPLTSVYGMSLSRRVGDVRTAPFPRMLLEACCASGNWGTGMSVWLKPKTTTIHPTPHVPKPHNSSQVYMLYMLYKAYLISEYGKIWKQARSYQVSDLHGAAEWKLLNSLCPMQSHSPHILMLAILSAREQGSPVHTFFSIHITNSCKSVVVNFSWTDEYFCLKMGRGSVCPYLIWMK